MFIHLPDAEKNRDAWDSNRSYTSYASEPKRVFGDFLEKTEVRICPEKALGNRGVE